MKLNRSKRRPRKQHLNLLNHNSKVYCRTLFKATKQKCLNYYQHAWLTQELNFLSQLQGALPRKCCVWSGRHRGYNKAFNASRLSTRNLIYMNELANIQPFTK